MSQTCGGSIGEERSCPCRWCVIVPNDNPNDPVLCRDCHHMELAHPPVVLSMGLSARLNSYKDAARIPGLRPSQPKATQLDAQEETNSGLKRKKPSFDGVGPSKVKKAKGKKVNPDGDWVVVGTVVLMPHGLDRKGELNITSSPSPSKVNEMIGQRLAVIKTSKGPLEFRAGWSTARMSAWFESLFPDAFKYMEAHPYKYDPSGICWGLLIKSQRSHSLANESLPSGFEVARYAQKDGKSCEKRAIYITCKHEIPFKVYSNWDDPVIGAESKSEDDDSISSISSGSITSTTDTPVKMKGKLEPGMATFTAKEKGKGRALSSRAEGHKARYKPVVVDASDSDIDALPSPRLLSIPSQHLPLLSCPITPPSLIETVKDLFLPATPSPPPSPRVPTTSVPYLLNDEATSILPSASSLPVHSNEESSPLFSTISSRSSSSGSNYAWQSPPWYAAGPSTVASGSSTINGAFLCFTGKAEGEKEEVDIWADDFKVTNSDDHIPG